MTPEEIKIEMFKAAIRDSSARPAAMARRLNVSATLIYLVRDGKATSLTVACEIARVLGRPLTEVFPGRYDHRSGKITSPCT
jgi:DNA-binding XRE family transcriptional regulator